MGKVAGGKKKRRYTHKGNSARRINKTVTGVNGEGGHVRWVTGTRKNRTHG